MPKSGVHEAEDLLGVSVTLLGVNAETLHRCGIVAAFNPRRHGLANCLRRRDRYAEQHSQQRQGDNAAPNQPVFNAAGMAERFPSASPHNMNDNILYHALARPRAPRPDPPLSPRKQRVFRIGPEQSRARSGEAYP